MHRGFRPVAAECDTDGPSAPLWLYSITRPTPRVKTWQNHPLPQSNSLRPRESNSIRTFVSEICYRQEVSRAACTALSVSDCN
jgi:hypothetical protein